VNVTADMGAEASQIGIHVFTITEYEDGIMNIFLEDYEWKQVRKCGECDDSGGKKVPVNIVVCCALLGSLLHARNDGVCFCNTAMAGLAIFTHKSA
jgi:hypothetical protein